MTGRLRHSRKFATALCALSFATGCALVTSDARASNPGDLSQMDQQMQMDRQLVEQGSLPPSVLGIDAQLAKVPPGSQKAIRLMKQKLALTQQHADRLGEQQESAVREQNDRLRMVGALTAPPAKAPSQPQDQQQRMCSVSNGQWTALQPC